MENSIATKTFFHVDAEHAALRFSVVVIFILLWIVLFATFNVFIPGEGVNILAIIIAFALTALLTQRIEKVLKDHWPSGRAVQIDNDRIQIVKGDKVQNDIDASQRVNVLLWRFQINRRSRVPKGWFMVACALEQDDLHLPVYTFMSLKDLENIKNSTGHFTLLQSQKEAKKQGNDNMRLAGEQRRLHTAESARWMEGAEMTQADFMALIRHLQEQYPQWMPSIF
jgi:hypothetical protein